MVVAELDSHQIGIREKLKTSNKRKWKIHLATCSSSPAPTTQYEVEDEGHVGGQRSLAVGAVRRWKTKNKIDASTREVMHLKTTTYIRCFIDMSMYNNFNEENKPHEL